MLSKNDIEHIAVDTYMNVKQSSEFSIIESLDLLELTKIALKYKDLQELSKQVPNVLDDPDKLVDIYREKRIEQDYGE